jgi:radical SAM superfamily enzyme YgiQ (UPF0313 family)
MLNKKELETPEVHDWLKSILANVDFEKWALLVQLPQISINKVNPTSAKNRWYFAYPPQGLLYVSAILSARWIQTEIVDLNFNLLSELQSKDTVKQDDLYASTLRNLEEKDTDVVCLSYMFDATFEELKKFITYIRSIKPTVCIVIGWVAATANAEKLLREKLADIIFKYEAEFWLNELVTFSRGESDDIPSNISFQADGKIHNTQQKRWGEEPLDIREEYKKIPIWDYHTVWTTSMFSKLTWKNLPYATLLTRRWCRAKCSFCSVRNFNWRWVRARENNSVMAEIDFLYREYWVRHFELLDDDFLYDLTSVKELIREMKDQFHDITWSANNGLIAASVDEELLDLMSQSWCLGFKVGLESGNTEILKRIHKPITMDKFYRFSEMTRKYPWLFISTNFILWTPEETFEQMLDSLKASIRWSLDWNNFYLYQHFENTEFANLFPEYDAKQSESSIWRESNVTHEHVEWEEKYSFTPMTSRRNDGKIGATLKSWDIWWYWIMNLSPKSCPSKAELQEIWFTFNTVANFLLMPAVRTNNTEKLKNGIQWISMLAEAYPNDPMMKCLEYFLKNRSWDYNKEELDAIRDLALSQISASEYWQKRDLQFHFSDFLSWKIPKIDPEFVVFAELDKLREVLS